MAVFPFAAADGSSACEGWNISKKLITQIVKQGKLQAVERFVELDEKAYTLHRRCGL
ncbi:MAG: hypothetical protein HY922_03740 [Elusimicrobia bacterium]|nr:hypothetical protein [Elusimicrobiota bacterium]